MDGEIGITAQKGFFEFLGEKALASLFFEGPLGALVAGGDNLEQLHLDAERGAQVRGDLLGLRKGERAFASGEDEFGRKAHGK